MKKNKSKILNSLPLTKSENRMLRLVMNFVLLPVSFLVLLGALVYLFRDTDVGIFLSICFIFASCASAFMWVHKNLNKQIERSDNVSKKLKDKNADAMMNLFFKSNLLLVLVLGYLLISGVFAFVYDVLQITTVSGFFNNWYFSLTTIATVGYGDIIPMGVGRFFASMQMVIGILYQVLGISIAATYFLNLPGSKKVK